jgi:hypothetical protein
VSAEPIASGAALLLDELEALAVERFPEDQATVRLFRTELERVLGQPAASPAEAVALLSRFEDFIEALLVRSRWR